MRFALVKNFCPSCGASLLSDDDASEIAGISKRLQGQEFIISLSATLSKDMIQNLVYDLSIYIKFDLSKEIDSASIEQKAEDRIAYDLENIGQPDDPSRVKRPTRPMARAGNDGESRQITSQVYRPGQDPESDDDYEPADSDDDVVEMGSMSGQEDSRVERLKRVAAMSGHKIFGGISRSDG
jgi:hypothetical protein